jgi:glucose/arabinose dehydrogenase
LLFGPDPFLYVFLGDAGIDAQNLKKWGGKIHRFDVDSKTGNCFQFYFIIKLQIIDDVPSDNPYYLSQDGILRSIYVIGLRNPYRTSFDRLSQRIFVADAGENVSFYIFYKCVE